MAVWVNTEGLSLASMSNTLTWITSGSSEHFQPRLSHPSKLHFSRLERKKGKKAAKMPQSSVHCCHFICASCCIHFFLHFFVCPRPRNLTPDLPVTVEGFLNVVIVQTMAGGVNQTRSCHTHTSHAARLHISPPRLPTDVATSARDKWARTWQTLGLAKNNMLSTDQLSRNAHTKCALFCNYLHFDMSGRGDSFLYSAVNGCLRGSKRCWERFVAVLALGSTRA